MAFQVGVYSGSYKQSIGVANNDGVLYAKKIAGYYYGTYLNNDPVGLSTVTLAANRVYLVPFCNPRIQAYDRIAWRTNSAVASNMRMGIYRSHPITGVPDRLILDTGIIDTGAAAFFESAIIVTLQPDMYYLAMHCNVARGGVYWLTSATTITPLGWVNPGTGGTQYDYYSFDQAFAALPSTAPATNIIHSASGMAAIWLRAT